MDICKSALSEIIRSHTKTQHFLKAPGSKSTHGEETFYGCSYLQDKVSMYLKSCETHVQNKIIIIKKKACLVFSENLARSRLGFHFYLLNG